MIRATLAMTFCLFLAACEEPPPPPDPPAPQMKTITGIVTFSERIGLTPESRLEMQLLDVSLADAPAKVIATMAADNPGQAPIPFSLAYDPTMIDERHSYSVSAKIFDRDQLIFISDTVHPVITRGADDEVTVRTVRFTRNKLAEPDAVLAGTKWLLTSAYGSTVSERRGSLQVHMQLNDSDETVFGFAGCNRFGGSYSLEGNKIKFGNVAITMMACPEGGDTEMQFMKALAEVDEYRINGGTMSGYAGGALIISFKAHSLK